jgi:excisionase family DNA binding protein
MNTNQQIITTLTADELCRFIQKSIETAISNKLSTPNPVTKQDEYLTINQISELLSISLPTIWAYRKRGILPFKRIGKRILFSRSEVETAMKNIDLKNKTVVS